MKEPHIMEIDAEELMCRIREELARHENLVTRQPQQNIMQVSIHLPPAINPEDSRSLLDKFLWKYGHKYARLIKKIPVLKKVVEKYYWRQSDYY